MARIRGVHVPTPLLPCRTGRGHPASRFVRKKSEPRNIRGTALPRVVSEHGRMVGEAIPREPVAAIT